MSRTIESAEVRHAQARVLIVDDDPYVHRVLGERLNAAQYVVSSAHDVEAALQLALQDAFDVVLLDLNLPDGSGLEALRRLKAEPVSASVVMISGEEHASQVVEAIRLGALDYLVKPLDPNKIISTVALAARATRLERENRRLRPELHERGTQRLVGCSTALRRLLGVLRRVADSEATVLIEGKPGTGKSTVAKVVHASGRRAQGPFVAATAESVTPESLEELLQQADRGVLLLEDVDLLGMAVQSRLVRYLKEDRTQRGATQPPDVRILATTSQRLPELVARGRFREDLFYRLNVFPLLVPALQERRDDIALLATHFLADAAAASNVAHKGFTASAMILLEAHPWPGNVAQLQNAVVRAHALAGASPIDRTHLLGPAIGLDLDPQAEQLLHKRGDDDEEEIREEQILPFEAEEKRLLARALKATHGNVRRAAELLKIGRATLYRKIQLYKLRLH